MTIETGKDKFNWVIIGMATILLILNFLLIQQNKALGSHAAAPESSLSVKVGTQLPALEGNDIDGQPLTIGYGEDPRKTLLLVFSPHCRACKENMPNWQEILRRIDHTAYRVVAVSISPEETKEYVTRYGLLGLPVIADLDLDSKAAYNLMASPQSILLSSEGVAERVWVGRLDEKDKRELAGALMLD